MFRTRETRPGPGALCTPGTTVPARPRVNPATAACRLATAGPCHPGDTTPSRDAFFTRHQQGFTGVRPSRPFPSPVAPGRNGDPRALPWAPHPAEQDPAAHARAGTSLRHWPGVTSPASPASLDALTQRERLHVAIHPQSAPRPGPVSTSATVIVPAQEHSSSSTRRSRPNPDEKSGLGNPAAPGLVNSRFSASQGAWSVDRYAPASVSPGIAASSGQRSMQVGRHLLLPPETPLASELQRVTDHASTCCKPGSGRFT